ncbi:metallophosphoesterase, partial [Candidatus Gracilibacteria bacterium]|nr:metallophosphoesterase [Candidatus Gracilibacteria bacterium]
MKIGIIHLTDIHITNKANFSEKIIPLSKVIINDLNDTEKNYIVISGDIANSGKKLEYQCFIKIIDDLKTLLFKDISKEIKIILVPGNHDCNFDLDNQIRKNSVLKANYETLGNDNSVINSCLCVQNDFWEFYNNYNSIPKNKISYKIIDKIGEKNICFHCHNTAWMSQITEQAGTLFFPVNLIKDDNENILFDINISVYHHPTNWFTPNTTPNNKKEFQEYLDGLSTLQIIGHEHEELLINRANLDNQTNVLDFSGKIFHDNRDIKKSGFQIIKIDINSLKGSIKKYNFEQNIYSLENENEFKINEGKNRKFNIKNEFIEEINEIKVPLTINNGNIKLSDIFVFPDIELINVEQKNIEDYIDSKKIVRHNDLKNITLVGDSQVGKTSLLYMIFFEYYDNGYYPVFLNGTELKNNDFNKIIRKSFEKIYSDNNFDFDKYIQINKEKKVILIDDIHEFKLPLKQMKGLIEKLKSTFEYIIITIDSTHNLSPQIQAEFNDFYNFSIKPLGYKKTNDLIIKYHSLKESNLNIVSQNQVFLQNIKDTYNQVRHLLGNKI